MDFLSLDFFVHILVAYVSYFDKSHKLLPHLLHFCCYTTCLGTKLVVILCFKSQRIHNSLW
jgi:hypothetical protein